MHHVSRRRVSSSAIVVATVLFVAPPASAQPIVYTRCARTNVSVEVTQEVTFGGSPRTLSRTLGGWDVYDQLPDVTHFFSEFNAPCDLVLREADGAERVLYDCTTTSTDEDACAAMDPAVSFDGRTIAFAVFRGSLYHPRGYLNHRVIDPEADNDRGPTFDFPNRLLSATHANIHLVDVQTGEVTLVLPGEHFDAGPAFLPDGRLMFTSNRDGHRSTIVFRVRTEGRQGARLWTMDLDGRNLDLASPDGLGVEQHPFVLSDGRVAFSSWQVGMGLASRHGPVGGITTLDNLFHIYTRNPDGSHGFALYGQHSGDHRITSMLGHDHKAAHFIAQTSDGRVWFADYYRGNNSGLGHVVGVMPEPEGQEGLGPHEVTDTADLFVPRDRMTFASWSRSVDGMAHPMDGPPLSHPSYADPLPFNGKVGHPAALPGGGLMVVWGKGACSTVAGHAIFEALGRAAPPHTSGAGGGTALNVIASLGMDTPGCDTGVYRATAIPSASPHDLELIVDTREFHELQARAVVPYEEIYGVERPALRPRADLRVSRSELEVGTPFGLLGAASITDRETHPFGGIHFQGQSQFHRQGTDTINYADEDLCGVRILAAFPNRGDAPSAEIAGPAGERLAILGEIPVRNRDATGAPRMDPSAHEDTSFLVRFPADTPYFMQAIDCEGRTLTTDQSWQSLRPGEMKTCGGCHVHSRPSRVSFEQTWAATATYDVPRLGEGSVPLLTGEVAGEVQSRRVEGYGLQVDLARDILPIFERRCVSCHGGGTPAAGLALDRPGTDEGSTWDCLVADLDQDCVPPARQWNEGAPIGRPQLTRYVRAFNALGSLLYWKARNRRTDGNTDDTYDATSPEDDRDVDFGPDHPTDITEEELGLLSRWIDLGTPGGPMELRDTQRPTLHLAAVVVEEAVTELRVGTVDVGSGIDPATLSVCVAEAAGACESSLADRAEMHGVLAIALHAPLTDPNLEVVARVRDRAGNETEVRRTVAWLLRAPPPGPGHGARDGGGIDGGVGTPDASDGPGAGPADGCACGVTRRSSAHAPFAGSLALALALALRRRARRRARDAGSRGAARTL